MKKMKTVMVTSLLLLIGCSGIGSNHINTEKQQDIHTYNDNGSIKETVVLLNGQKVGTKKYKYYPDGSVKSLARYKKGVKHGESIRYFQDGRVKRTTQWLDGMKTGKQIAYYQNGEVWYNYELLNGVVIQGAKYDKQGNLITKTKHQKGKGETKIHYLYKDGIKVAEEQFYNGKLIVRKRFSTEGKELGSTNSIASE